MKTLEAVVATSEKVERTQIRFDEGSGLINAVGDLGVARERLDYYYGDDCYLFAGMGDVHIHAREDISGKNNYKEDFLTAQAAMHNGGLCHAGDMPNNPVPPIDKLSYEEKLKLALKASGEIWIYAGIGPGTRPLPYSVPYKVYMGPSIGELFFKDLHSLENVLSHYRDQVVSFHCEDPVDLENHKDEAHHHLRRPGSSEVIATKDALELIEKFNLKGKLCHYSTGEGLELIRKARQRGVKVDIEVTPQHLYFDLEHLAPESWGKFQMNPPIRSMNDRQTLLEAVKSGEITYLATDHAPHTQEEKERGTSGLTGLDTFAPFVTWLLQQGVDPKVVAKMTTENPGQFFNQFLPSWQAISPVFAQFGKGIGYLKSGYRANFTVLNLNRPYLVTADKLKTKVGHSPFINVAFPGQLEALFIGGKKV